MFSNSAALSFFGVMPVAIDTMAGLRCVGRLAILALLRSASCYARISWKRRSRTRPVSRATALASTIALRDRARSACGVSIVPILSDVPSPITVLLEWLSITGGGIGGGILAATDWFDDRVELAEFDISKPLESIGDGVS